MKALLVGLLDSQGKGSYYPEGKLMTAVNIRFIRSYITDQAKE